MVTKPRKMVSKPGGRPRPAPPGDSFELPPVRGGGQSRPYRPAPPGDYFEHPPMRGGNPPDPGFGYQPYPAPGNPIRLPVDMPHPIRSYPAPGNMQNQSGQLNQYNQAQIRQEKEAQLAAAQQNATGLQNAAGFANQFNQNQAQKIQQAQQAAGAQNAAGLANQQGFDPSVMRLALANLSRMYGQNQR